MKGNKKLKMLTNIRSSVRTTKHGMVYRIIGGSIKQDFTVPY